MKAALRTRLEALERKRAGTVAPPDFMYWEDAAGTGGFASALSKSDPPVLSKTDPVGISLGRDSP